MFECGPVFDRQGCIRRVRRNPTSIGMLVEQLTEGGKGMQTTKWVRYAD